MTLRTYSATLAHSHSRGGMGVHALPLYIGTPASNSSATALRPAASSRWCSATAPLPAASSRWCFAAAPRPAASSRWNSAAAPRPAASSRWNSAATPCQQQLRHSALTSNSYAAAPRKVSSSATAPRPATNLIRRRKVLRFG